MSDSEEEILDKKLKLVFLGDSGVGKSCLVARYCHNSFSKQYCPTSGVEFLLKRDVIQKTKNITLHIWDVGGESRKMLDKFIFNANLVAVIYDVTNEGSFLNVASWVATVREICASHGNPPQIALIGNKSDMEHQRIVKQDRQNKLASELHISSLVASARTGEGVSFAFHKMIADFLGLRLTRAQVEEFQRVVKAEISTHSSYPPPAVPRAPVPSSSSVCAVQ